MAATIGAMTIVSLFVQAILYGVFVLLFALSSFVLLRKQRRRTAGINKPMVGVSLAMFIISSVHLGVDLRRTMEAFLHHTSDPAQYLLQVNTTIYVIKATAYAMQTLVGDGFIIYRLYLVWNGDKRTYFPILICFFASIGVGANALRVIATASPDTPIFELYTWIVTFYALTLFTNFTCTLLIVSRIWWVSRQVSGSVIGRKTVPAMVIVIESGIVYSACLVILVALYLSGSFAQYVVFDSTSQIIGIVFTLVIVRVGLGLSNETIKQEKPTTILFAAGDPPARSVLLPMHPINVTVSTTNWTRSDLDASGEHIKISEAHSESDRSYVYQSDSSKLELQSV